MRVEHIENITAKAAFQALRELGRPFLFSGSAAAGRRYSYAGAGPLSEINFNEGDDPFIAVSKAIEGQNEKGPFPFNSGVVAYFSYDLKELVEPTRRFRKKPGPDIPLFMGGLYDPVFVYDHQDEKGFLVSMRSSQERFSLFAGLLEKARFFEQSPIPEANGFSSDTTKDEYIAAVRKVKEYIASGDIYQINLSQRLFIEWQGDPFCLYMKLLETHPAPLSSYLDFGGFQLISNSPECLLRVTGNVAETSPIKGTRRRGSGKAEDEALIQELMASRKERAEHVMIVDLERNDLGKVSVPGSVEVSSFEKVETYPHLHHLVSTIRGTLMQGFDAPLALRAMFPGGSITGAPKVRAMEIIDEMERSARSIYTGGIGWFDMAGDAEVSIAIRTATYKDGVLHLGVGGGIVADSVPEDEYDETMLKAQDFLKTLGVAR